MDRQIARGYATNALCAIIGNDGTLYTVDFKGWHAVGRFTKDGQATNPLDHDARTQAKAIMFAHRYLGITMPVMFESEINDF